MNRIPFAKQNHELYPWLTPFAFESFDFEGYDIVISITSAEAKTVLTKPHTKHVCYCLTPTRYLWSENEFYQKNPGFGIFNPIASMVFSVLKSPLKKWDYAAAQRPDFMIAISSYIAGRIQKYYGRITDRVIYPPVDTHMFIPSKTKKGDYFLSVSRLVPYKRVDIIIRAFNELGLPLLVIGDGSEKKKLMQMARGNITFTGGGLTDEELARYYKNCRAFVFAACEEFGIVVGEAQAAGVPVIAYSKGGTAEIVKDGETGILFDRQSVKVLKDAIMKFQTLPLNKEACRKNALRFDTKRFQTEFRDYIETMYNTSL